MLDDPLSSPKASKVRWKAGSCSFNLFKLFGEALIDLPLLLFCRSGVNSDLVLFAFGSVLGLGRGSPERVIVERVEALSATPLISSLRPDEVIISSGVFNVIDCLLA